MVGRVHAWPANVRACFFMVVAMLAFASNDMVVKHVAGALPIVEIIAIRGAMVIVLLMVWYAVMRRRAVALPLPPFNRLRLIAARALMEVLATFTFLFALARIALSDVFAVLQSLPLVVTLGAVLFFNERVGWRRWAAIAIGFAGVLIIIRPGFEGFQPAILLVVLAVLFAAGRDLMTKAMPTDVHSFWVTSATAVMVCASGLIACTVVEAWQPVSLRQLVWLALGSCFLLAAYLSIILAMRLGDVSSVAPFRYTSLIWAILGGVLVFGEIPDPVSLLGASLVVGMGLFAWYRERMAGRTADLASQ